LRLLRLRNLLDLLALRSLVALRSFVGLRCLLGLGSLLRLGFVCVRHIHLPAYASTTSLLDLKKRTLRPSANARSPFFVTGFHTATFETSMPASFSTIPPCTWRCGFGLV